LDILGEIFTHGSDPSLLFRPSMRSDRISRRSPTFQTINPPSICHVRRDPDNNDQERADEPAIRAALPGGKTPMQLGQWATRSFGRPGAALLVSASLALAMPAPAEAQRAGASAPSSSSQSARPKPNKAKSAKSAKSAPYQPMKVVIVRSAIPGCEPNCVEWIAAQGRIDHTTPAAFKRTLARIGKRKLPVLVESLGGTVDDGIAAARLLRANGLDVVVGKTVFSPCPLSKAECRKLKSKGIEFGTPVAKYSACASSCAFVLAGGVRRYVGPWSGVGLHEIKSISTVRRVQRLYRVERRDSGWGTRPKVRKVLLKERTLWTKTVEGPSGEKTYDRIARFFVEMGVSGGIMPLLRSAPHSSIRALNAAELKQTRLATDFRNGEQVIAALSIAMPAPPPTNAAPQPTTAPPAAKPSDQAAPAKPVTPTSTTASIAPAKTAPAMAPAAKPENSQPPPRATARKKPKPRPSTTSVRDWSPFAQ
jgi:hypothetical protein